MSQNSKDKENNKFNKFEKVENTKKKNKISSFFNSIFGNNEISLESPSKEEKTKIDSKIKERKIVSPILESPSKIESKNSRVSSEKVAKKTVDAKSKAKSKENELNEYLENLDHTSETRKNKTSTIKSNTSKKYLDNKSSKASASKAKIADAKFSKVSASKAKIADAKVLQKSKENKFDIDYIEEDIKNLSVKAEKQIKKVNRTVKKAAKKAEPIVKESIEKTSKNVSKIVENNVNPSIEDFSEKLNTKIDKIIFDYQKSNLPNNINITADQTVKAVKKASKSISKTISENAPIVKEKIVDGTDKTINNVKKASKSISKTISENAPIVKEKIVDGTDKTINNVKKASKSISKTISENAPIVKEKINDSLEKVSKSAKKIITDTSENIKELINKKKRPIVLEYYDLPFKYDETTVKVLAQNPNTLFIYWEISDKDKKRLKKNFGKDFFEKTRPVLIIHNITENYSYELDINDFANNWYIHVDDSKCKYKVELGRRMNEITEETNVSYVSIASSNIIEAPNDHILFYRNGDKLLFRNVKNGETEERTFEYNNYSNDLNKMYVGFKIDEKENKFDFNNPSSQNPTSNVM